MEIDAKDREEARELTRGFAMMLVGIVIGAALMWLATYEDPRAMEDICAHFLGGRD